MKLFRLLTVLAAVLLIFGGTVLLMNIRSQASSLQSTPPVPPANATTNSAPPAASTISGQPAELQIPNLNMDLPIIPGYYNTKTQTWTLSLDKVQYATITPEPNNASGDTFIYGHYRQAVFARLHTIPANSEAEITTSNGHVFTYQLAKIEVVNPDDSAAVFNYQGPPILTIQTCTGLLFQNRQLFIFNFVGVH